MRKFVRFIAIVAVMLGVILSPIALPKDIYAASSTVATVNSTDAIGQPYLYHTFYYNGRHWVFYSNGTNLVWKSSTDGSSWSATTNVRTLAYGSYASVYFDSINNKVSYTAIYGIGVGNSIYYRRGVPNADGTITWDAAEQTVSTAGGSDAYSQPSIVVDSTGYAWISYRIAGATTEVRIIENDHNDGTWHTASTKVLDTSDFAYNPYAVKMTSGKLMAIWQENAALPCDIYYDIYNGAAWAGAAQVEASVTQGQTQAVSYGDVVMLIYWDRNNNEIRSYRYSAGWGAAATVSTKADNYPSISSVGDDTYYAIYATQENDHVYYKVYSAGWGAEQDWIDETVDEIAIESYKGAFLEANDNIIGYLYETQTGAPYDLSYNFLQLVVIPTVTTDTTDDILSDEATLNGTITDNGGEQCTNYGFAWDTASHAEPSSATAPTASAYANSWEAGAGNYANGSYDHDTGATLNKGTVYYVRFAAYNSAGWDWGDEDVFTTIDDCAIDTEPETNVTATSATLNAFLSDDGGEACEVRWGYGTVSKAAGNFDTYDTVTAWGGSYTSGQYPTLNIAGLTPDDDYYFRIQARNDAGTITSATEGDFHTDTSIGTPSNLKATPKAEEIILVWTKGTGASNTLVVRKVGSIPTSKVDGTQIYTGTESTYSDTGLTSGITYGYMAWGSDGAGSYSSSNTTEIMTTLSFVSGNSFTEGATTETPEDIADAPDVSGLDATPLGTWISEWHAVTGIPVGIAGVIIFAGMALVFGVIAYAMSHSMGAVMFAEVIALVLGYIMRIIDWRFLFFVAGLAIIYWFMRERAHQ